jgi:iron complex outermembrane recepter protein
VRNEEARELDGVTLVIDHAFGWADLRATTAWRQFETVNREDEDGTNRIALYFDTANVEDNESWYQEFKLSARTGAFDWVGGISYYSEDARQVSDTHAFTDSIDTLLRNLGMAATPDGTLFGFTSDVLAANDIPVSLRGLGWREAMYNSGKFTATAVFGDVIWSATERMHVTFGLRYTRDEKEFSWLNGPREAPELDGNLAALQAEGFFDVFPIPPEAYLFDVVFDLSQFGLEGQKLQLEDSWDDISPRLVLDYQVTPAVMVFGSLAKGYKAGGYNSVEVGSRFDNEDVWNLEGGVKSVFGEIGVVVNASAYYYAYDDKQAIALVAGVNGSGVPQYVVDTSDEEAFGLDLDARWQPVYALTLTANVAYIDATYKEKLGRDGADLAGEPTGEPHLSGAFGASYVWTLGHAGLIDLSAMHAYRGKTRCNQESATQGDCRVSPNFEVGAATNRTDVRLAWTSKADRVGAAAFITNLFDEQYVTGVNNLTAATLGTPFAAISAPRLWGLELRVNF